MSKIYTGIGSRDIPQEIYSLFTKLGSSLAKCGYTLRSGGADGSDKAFEVGCDKYKGLKEIYVPWKGFNGSESELYNITDEMYRMAEKYHPYWNNLKNGAKKLHARNCSQILGNDLKTPTGFVICYTKDGKLQGGTAQALRIANDYKIKVFNAGLYGDLDNFVNDIKEWVERRDIMRELETIQTQEKLNKVFAADEKGNGGANHQYNIVGLPIDENDMGVFQEIIRFQNGARKLDDSVHGVLDTDLLEIVRDRLTSFQAGAFASEYNEKALFHIEEALKWMNKRVEDRISRNVLGTMNK